MFDELPSLPYDQGEFGGVGTGDTASGGAETPQLCRVEAVHPVNLVTGLRGDRVCISPEFRFANIPTSQVGACVQRLTRASPLAQTPRGGGSGHLPGLVGHVAGLILQ